MNSATSALNAAATAAGVGPGDEVIVSPYTMSASAVCALVNGAIPVFADIEPETFCLDPESVRSLINARTKAIVAVDLFGCPADFEPLMALAAEHGLVVIEDAAQAPGREPRRALGRHARAHRRLQPQLPQDDPVGRGRRRGHRRRPARRAPGAGAQPRRGRRGRHGLRRLRHARLQLPHGRARGRDRRGPALAPGGADRAADRARGAALRGPVRARGHHAARACPPDTRHVYYVHAIRLDEDVLGVSRDAFAAALEGRGRAGQPRLRRRRCTASRCTASAARPPSAIRATPASGRYEDGQCPTCERVQEHELLLHALVHAGLDEGDVDDVVAAFRKVHSRRGEL